MAASETFLIMVFWLDHAHWIGVWVKVHSARWCNLTSPAKINNHCPESIRKFLPSMVNSPKYKSFSHVFGLEDVDKVFILVHNLLFWEGPTLAASKEKLKNLSLSNPSDCYPIFYPVLWGSLGIQFDLFDAIETKRLLRVLRCSCICERCLVVHVSGLEHKVDPKMTPTHQNHLGQMKNKLPEQRWSTTVQWWKLCHFRHLQAALLSKGLTWSYSFVEPPHQLEIIGGLHRPTYRWGGEVHVSCHFLQLKRYW